MCGRSYRPRPDNGSGDSPRPPFLSEFVNHIGKLSLVEVVYHLFGGTLRPRVHPHVERSIRLKTKSACRVGELQAASPMSASKPSMVAGRWSFAISPKDRCSNVIFGQSVGWFSGWLTTNDKRPTT